MILGQNLSRFRMNALKQFFQNDPRLMIVHSRALSNFFHLNYNIQFYKSQRNVF